MIRACALPATLAVFAAGCGGTADTPGPTRTATPSASARAAATPAPPALCDGTLNVRVLGQVKTPAATELSGLARSRSGTFWTHNDSGDGARVFELGRDGSFRREVVVAGAEAIDWEDIAIRGRTLYIADIGDNTGQRTEIAVYRFPEPTGPTAIATKIVLRYPDRPHDAEALLVDPRNGQLAIVTKDFGGASDVFTGRAGTLKRSASLKLGIGQAITAGDVSADGRTIVLRSYDRAFVWQRKANESLARALKRAPCVAGANLLDEGQGESLALSRNGRAFYTVPEGANPPLRRYGG